MVNKGIKNLLENGAKINPTKALSTILKTVKKSHRRASRDSIIGK